MWAAASPPTPQNHPPTPSISFWGGLQDVGLAQLLVPPVEQRHAPRDEEQEEEEGRPPARGARALDLFVYVGRCGVTDV